MFSQLSERRSTFYDCNLHGLNIPRDKAQNKLEISGKKLIVCTGLGKTEELYPSIKAPSSFPRLINERTLGQHRFISTLTNNQERSYVSIKSGPFRIRLKEILDNYFCFRRFVAFQ